MSVETINALYVERSIHMHCYWMLDSTTVVEHYRKLARIRKKNDVIQTVDYYLYWRVYSSKTIRGVSGDY
jgi:hypothetical protein